MNILSISIISFIFVNLYISPIAGTGGSSGGYNSAASDEGSSRNKEYERNLRDGHPLLLDCNFTDVKLDDVKVKWFKDNKEILPDKHQEHQNYTIYGNATLFVAKASVATDLGVYRCQTEDYLKPLSHEFTVFSLFYKKLPKSTTVLQGDKLLIACEVEGNPLPVVTWKKDEQNIEDSSLNISRYHFESNDKNVPNATLVIEEAQYEDRATYACFVSIAGINYWNTTTYVRVKDMYAALWPFLGICVEVFILCLIIFIYEKRRAKAEFEESDTDQPPEQKNKPDQNKDVRQRK